MVNLKPGEFPTEVVRRKGFRDLIFAETIYTSGQVIETHSHNQAGFLIVLSGKFQETHEKRNLECNESDVLFRPGGHLHAARFGRQPSSCFNVEFGSSWVRSLKRITHDRMKIDPALFSGGRLFQLGRKLYHEFRISDLDSSLIMEGLVLEMLGRAGRIQNQKKSDSEPLWLKRVRERIHEHFAEPLSVQDLAIEAGVHPVYLSRTFHLHYGQSLGEYVRALRFQFCCDQLSRTNQALSKIGMEAGFSDQAHFSRVFKQRCGMTPLEYRRIFRKV